jgi:hypothetical protein
MSRKRRKDFGGCSIEAREGWLRLRWRWIAADGAIHHVARTVGLDETEENRLRLEPLRKVVGSLVQLGKDPAPYLDEMLAGGDAAKNAPLTTAAAPVTVEAYYRVDFIERMKPPLVRKAQARDLRRHIEGYILPRIGGVPLSELRPKDIRALQAELLATKSTKTKKPLSVKTAKNAISGSFRTMVGQAMVDDLVAVDLFAGIKWPKWPIHSRPGNERGSSATSPRSASPSPRIDQAALAPARALSRVRPGVVLELHAAVGSVGAPVE